MSDYVAFATAEHSTWKELVSGFNGLPISTALLIEDISAITPPTLHPAVTPLPWLHTIYWRIKKIAVTGSFTWTRYYESGRLYQVGSWSATDHIIPIIGGITREKDLMTIPSRQWESNSTDPAGSVTTYEDLDAAEGDTTTVNIGSVRLYMTGGPPIGVSPFSTNFHRLPSGELCHAIQLGVYDIVSGIFSGASDFDTGEITADLMGIEVPMGFSFLSAANGDSGSGTFAVTIAEYWPYAAPPVVLYPRSGYQVGDTHPNAGSPIYNTATGAQLLDPVTGF